MSKISAPDQFKIPAFQRKRSLAAKARKVSRPATALQRLQAGISVVKPVRKRRTVASSTVVSRSDCVERESFSSPLLGDYQSSYQPSCQSSVEVGGLREMHLCGRVEDFFDKISVVAVKVTSSIRVGDRLVFEAEYGLFEQVVDSMQINREDVVTAYNGDDLGIKVLAKPKKGGSVYKVV